MIFVYTYVLPYLIVTYRLLEESRKRIKFIFSILHIDYTQTNSGLLF
jgi:predicted transcriptional regulator